MDEFIGGIPYGAIKHVRGIINGGMSAKEAAAGPFVPQTFLELLKDIQKNTPKR
jgi:hypothetical protein